MLNSEMNFECFAEFLTPGKCMAVDLLWQSSLICQGPENPSAEEHGPLRQAAVLLLLWYNR